MQKSNVIFRDTASSMIPDKLARKCFTKTTTYMDERYKSYQIGAFENISCAVFPKKPLFFTCLLYKYFENSVGRGEIAC